MFQFTLVAAIQYSRTLPPGCGCGVANFSESTGSLGAGFEPCVTGIDIGIDIAIDLCASTTLAILCVAGIVHSIDAAPRNERRSTVEVGIRATHTQPRDGAQRFTLGRA